MDDNPQPVDDDYPDDAMLGTGASARYIGRSHDTLRRWRRLGIGPPAILLVPETTTTPRQRDFRYVYRIADLRAYRQQLAAEVSTAT